LRSCWLAVDWFVVLTVIELTVTITVELGRVT
jgi:hypothetical protein